MPFTKFDPLIHGFHFTNSFTNHLIFDIETHGLCGGMAFASLDYFHAGLPAPTHEGPDFPDGKVPPEGSVLRNYIYGRMVDTLVSNAGTWLRVVAGPVFNPVRFTKNRIPALLSAIDDGQPVALGLIGSTSVKNAGAGNHQVACFGYEKSADGKKLTLHIYDNNFPDRTTTLETDPTDPETIRYSSGQKWLGFFMEDYRKKNPTYRDLRLSTGIAIDLEGPTEVLPSPFSLTLDEDGLPVDPGPHTVQYQGAGEPFSARFSVVNIGAFPARLARLVLTMDDPSGDVTEFGKNVVTSIAPGGTADVVKQVASFQNEPGGYTLTADFVTAKGKKLRLPVGPGSDNNVSFHVVREKGKVLPPIDITRTVTSKGVSA